MTRLHCLHQILGWQIHDLSGSDRVLAERATHVVNRSRVISDIWSPPADAMFTWSDDVVPLASASAAALPSFRAARPPRRLLVVTLHDHDHDSASTSHAFETLSRCHTA